jgi:hypothetical protein
MPPSTRKIDRTPEDRAADRTTVNGLVAELRTARGDLRNALQGLPAPASRTAAQRRDALILRTLRLLVSAQLVSWGVSQSDDRDNSAT